MRARVDAIVTTEPLAARSIVSAARASRKVLVRLVPITRDHSASVSRAIGLPILIPALQTSASSLASCAATSRSSPPTDASSDTSHTTYRPPDGAVPFRSMSATTTYQPSRASRAAIAAPMPFAPPVTSATLTGRSTTDVLLCPRRYRGTPPIRRRLHVGCRDAHLCCADRARNTQ